MKRMMICLLLAAIGVACLAVPVLADRERPSLGIMAQ
jgi:hypothetical protein